MILGVFLFSVFLVFRNGTPILAICHGSPKLKTKSTSRIAVGHLFVKNPKICGKQEDLDDIIYDQAGRSAMNGTGPGKMLSGNRSSHIKIYSTNCDNSLYAANQVSARDLEGEAYMLIRKHFHRYRARCTEPFPVQLPCTRGFQQGDCHSHSSYWPCSNLHTY